MILLAAQTFKERFLGQKPVEESVSTITGGFDRLTDRLDHEIERQAEQITELRAENHRLRNDLQKLKAYAFIVFQHIDILEARLQAAGLELPTRPAIPSLN